MKQAVALLRDERGNLTIFVLTIFFFMVLVVFTVLFNISAIFACKEAAANSAEQASLAATGILYDEVENAIHAYDLSIERLIDPVFIWPLVEEAMSSLQAAHPDWAASEVRFAAIDQVLLAALPVTPQLEVYIWAGLDRASQKVPGVVSGILASNKSTLQGSSIKMFDGEDRIEVKTSVRYESQRFGLAFMPEHAEPIYQTGKSRPIGFVKATSWGQQPSVTLGSN
ncbi:pilus assembly protein TadG-related protein [Brevibacillus sp. GCM10020057]|uniref:pilus assembly protein TadG-related protein n=1 Tax=Brevibacillus sp. GCM10020057 TaxID=3317327 RepID=UPI003636A4E2